MLTVAEWLLVLAMVGSATTLVTYHVVDAIEWRRLKRKVRASILASQRQSVENEQRLRGKP